MIETPRPPRSSARRLDRSDRLERAEAVPAAPQTPGEVLRAARLRRRLSLAEAEQGTRIRQRYLQALEDDDYSIIPAGVYSVGFLRNYAIFLGVPPEEVLVGFNADRKRRDRRVKLQSVAPPIQLNVSRSLWLLLGGCVIGVFLIVLAWLGLSDPNAAMRTNGVTTGSNRAAAAAPAASPTVLITLPPLAPAATPTSAPTPVATAATAASAAATAAATSTSKAVEVELKTVDRAWVRATVDGKIVLEETLPAGQSFHWSGQQSVALRVGNGAGVDVSANGQHLGTLGPAGQPADREFSKS